MRIARVGMAVVLGCWAMAAASCELGAETKEPLFKMPAGKRVVVFVDARPNQNVPPEFAAQLGDKISNLLFQYRGAEQVLPQARVLELRRDAVKYSQMSVADVAQAAGADVVLHVDLVTFAVLSISDGSITQGVAQALVKVVDTKGQRLWPAGGVSGAGVGARVEPAFSEQRNRAVVQQMLIDQLASRISRAFVTYTQGDPVMSK